MIGDWERVGVGRRAERYEKRLCRATEGARTRTRGAGRGSARRPSRRSRKRGSGRRSSVVGRRSSTMVSGRAAREDADARGGGDETAATPEIVSLVTNEREAGEMWRVDRFKEFRFRVRCAGLESDPEFAEALERMAALTRELSEMSAAQARDASEAPWWRDGEYDEARAEEANDDGMRKIGEQRYEEAFEAFTEAIRLEPRRAVYHANRAAAGLKLQRYRVAADDAACAIERDSNYLKALIRGGTANLRLRCADKALKMFDAALAVAPEDERALRGKREAAQALAAAEAEAERQRGVAVEARLEAEARLASLQSLVEAMSGSINTRVKNLEGGTQVRLMMLGAAEDHLELLREEAEASGDPVLFHTVGRALVSLGDLAGGLRVASLGDERTAEAYYLEALGIYDDLLEDPDAIDPSIRSTVSAMPGRIVGLRADLAIAEQRWDDAKALVLEQQRRLEPLAGSGDLRTRRDYHMTFEKLGDLELHHGDPRVALGHYAAHRDAMQAIVDADRDGDLGRRVILKQTKQVVDAGAFSALSPWRERCPSRPGR